MSHDQAYRVHPLRTTQAMSHQLRERDRRMVANRIARWTVGAMRGALARR